MVFIQLKTRWSSPLSIHTDLCEHSFQQSHSSTSCPACYHNPTLVPALFGHRKAEEMLFFCFPKVWQGKRGMNIAVCFAGSSLELVAGGESASPALLSQHCQSCSAHTGPDRAQPSSVFNLLVRLDYFFSIFPVPGHSSCPNREEKKATLTR